MRDGGIHERFEVRDVAGVGAHARVAAAASAASSMSETNTSRAAAAKPSAMTRPMPPAPAVIATRRPVRSTGRWVVAPGPCLPPWIEAAC